MLIQVPCSALRLMFSIVSGRPLTGTSLVRTGMLTGIFKDVVAESSTTEANSSDARTLIVIVVMSQSTLPFLETHAS